MQIIDNLIAKIGLEFEKIEDPRGHQKQYSLRENLMTAFSMFHLKDDSLLSYRKEYDERQSNLERIYGIKNLPKDTALRGCLDKINPIKLLETFEMLLGEAEKNGVLKSYKVLKNKYLAISCDGTEYFCSSKISCPCCLVKNHKKGETTTYHHQLLAAALVHPDQKAVLPIYAEPIVKNDGDTKNDCERNALKRIVPSIEKVVPKNQPLIFLLDALYANAPTIRSIQSNPLFNFITVIKEGYVLEQINQLDKKGELSTLVLEGTKTRFKIHWASNLILNGANQEVLVNYVSCEEEDKKTKKSVYFNKWITDIPLNINILEEFVSLARTRWKIENETFNTLKNQGYNLEHNYGHGQLFLSSTLALLMFLAFFADQLAQLLDANFQKIWLKFGSKKLLWQKIRQIFDLLPCASFDALYRVLSKDTHLNFALFT